MSEQVEQADPAAPAERAASGATRSLPASAYTDPQLYADEMREVFERGWALAGHASELAEVGQYVAITIGREPVVVIRGSDGRLRALSNVCRHRGSTIVAGAGTARKVFRCPYHAWTYRLDGGLAAAPSARGFNDFDRDAVRLPEFPVEEFAGLVFAGASAEPMPLPEVLGPAGPFLESLNLDRLEVYRWGPSGAGRARALRARRKTEHRFWEDFDENWKILADNYLEDYHVPVAHPALVRLNDVKQTVGEGEEWSEWSSFPLRERSSRVPLERLYQRLIRGRKMPGLPDRFDHGWGHAHIWPTTFLEIYPHHIDTWQLEPLGLNRTRAWTMSLVDPGAGPRDRLARWAAHRIQHDVMAEDVEITSRVQRGVRAPSYGSGVLNDEHEVSVVRFQRQLRKLLPRIAELEAGERR